MTFAYIGLGSNMNNPAMQVSKALAALRDIPLTEVTKYSSLYKSKPIGPQDQPDFINAIAMLKTGLTPNNLLEHMQAIENLQGRSRNGKRWGPRIIDLDLLIYGDKQINEKNLIIPHPEIANRNFVLQPLLEIDRDLNIPGLGLAKDLLDHLANDELQKIEYQ